MAVGLRFPLLRNGPAGPQERNQIITLANAVSQFDVGGGGAAYALTLPWKQLKYQTEVPYCSIVIEFTAEAPVVIGDGTVAGMIGLFGEIFDVDSPSLGGRYLLGVLGITLAGTKPQIPLVTNTLGYAQVVNIVGVYDALAIGGINGDVVVAEDVTVRARPVRSREYPG